MAYLERFSRPCIFLRRSDCRCFACLDWCSRQAGTPSFATTSWQWTALPTRNYRTCWGYSWWSRLDQAVSSIFYLSLSPRSRRFVSCICSSRLYYIAVRYMYNIICQLHKPAKVWSLRPCLQRSSCRRSPTFSWTVYGHLRPHLWASNCCHGCSLPCWIKPYSASHPQPRLAQLRFSSNSSLARFFF